jgi:hypothetical protein
MRQHECHKLNWPEVSSNLTALTTSHLFLSSHSYVTSLEDLSIPFNSRPLVGYEDAGGAKVEGKIPIV